jgi:hypothetical protein
MAACLDIIYLGASKMSDYLNLSLTINNDCTNTQNVAQN